MTWRNWCARSGLRVSEWRRIPRGVIALRQDHVASSEVKEAELNLVRHRDFAHGFTAPTESACVCVRLVVRGQHGKRQEHTGAFDGFGRDDYRDSLRPAEIALHTNEARVNRGAGWHQNALRRIDDGRSEERR